MADKQTVFVSGNFNILHPGHLRLLRFARELGSKLIVGVFSDRVGEHGVHIPENLRLEGVRANNWVGEAILVDEPVEQVISRLQPDIVVKGKEFETAWNPELEVVRSYGGKLVFSSGEAAFSSLDLIRKNLSGIEGAVSEVPKEFLSRHDLAYSHLEQTLDRFSELNVCVIGDLIVDEYITCDPLGMSQEDPSIVVTPIDTQRFVGGAGIVAAHAAGLGAKVDLISVTGDDPIREYANQALAKYGVNAKLLCDENRPTTLKQRYRAQNKTLLRVSHLHQSSIDKKLQNKMLEQAIASLDNAQLLVFSDFNYGCLPQAVVDEVIKYGNAKNLVMVADSQCSSQVGDIGRFRGMDLLTPTEREVRVSLRNQEDGLVVIAEKLRVLAKAKNITLKLGSEGVLLHNNEESGDSRTDRLPALNSTPIDVAGAGDSMLITSGLALATGANPWLAAALGNIAAALQVGRLGNRPLSRDEFVKELHRNSGRLSVL